MVKVIHVMLCVFYQKKKKKKKKRKAQQPLPDQRPAPLHASTVSVSAPMLVFPGSSCFSQCSPNSVLRVGPWCDFRGCRTGWFPPLPFIPASHRRGPVGEAPHCSSRQVPSGQPRPTPRKRVDLPSTSLWLAGPAPRGEGRGPLRDQAAAGGLLWTGKVHGYRRQGLGSRLLCYVTLLKSLSVSGPQCPNHKMRTCIPA